MKNIKIFFIILLTIKSSFSLLCKESTFDPIFPNNPKNFQVGPLKEVCLKYKLSDKKNAISLIFSVGKSYTAEVVIYKSPSLILMNDGNYYNYEEKYFIIENTFKEINVKDFYDYVYIIIRDSKNYFFYDNIILYDSELPIILEPNIPINLKYFMKNNKYSFHFSSNKNIQLVYSTKIQSQKLLTVEYDGNKIMEQKLDNNDNIINIKNENLSYKLLKIIVENTDNNENSQEFSLVLYEKEENEFIEILEEKLIKINYIKNNLVQNFYFFSNISKYEKSSSINFKLDYNTKSIKYINIISDIIYSNITLNSEDFIKLIPSENKIEYSYDLNSDDNIKFFFNDKEKNYPYKYFIIKIEIKNYGIYFNPRYFTISLSKQSEEINLKNIKDYQTNIVNINSNMKVPNYYKLNLKEDSKYIFSSQNQDYMTLIKGDLLIQSSINKNYIDNEKDIIIISGTSELTMQISDIELNKEKIYIEKIKSEDVTIIENERTDGIIKITMTEEYCKDYANKKKFLIGNYDKDKYENKAINTVKYWKSEDGGDIELYYKNDLSIDKTSLFPSDQKYQKLPFTAFILDTNIDLFTFKCSKPGTLLIKPLMKSFIEKTHMITQNSINFISLNSKEEILQLTSPLKLAPNSDQYLYLSIQAVQENNEVIIKPDTNGVFEEGKIKGNEIFVQKIDINKYKSDELAIKIISDGTADIEVIEIIHYDFSEYFKIDNEKKNKVNKNNFVKFVNKDTKSLKINIDGLNQVPVYYSIVKLAINDINYIPLVYNFKNVDIIHKNLSQNDLIEMDNKFFEKEDEIKKYVAFVFSIKNSNIKYEYNVQIKEITDSFIIKDKSWIIIVIVIIAILLLLMGIFLYIRRKKKKKIISIEDITPDQSLFPNKKYILSDILNNNE